MKAWKPRMNPRHTWVMVSSTKQQHDLMAALLTSPPPYQDILQIEEGSYICGKACGVFTVLYCSKIEKDKVRLRILYAKVLFNDIRTCSGSLSNSGT